MKKTTALLLSTPIQGLALSALLLAGLAFATGTTEASQPSASASSETVIEIAAAPAERELPVAAERTVRQVGPVFLPDDNPAIDLKHPDRSGIGLVWTWLVDEPDHAPAAPQPTVEYAAVN
jgi:hypothetical protein